MAEKIDWTRFELRIKVKATVETLYDCWATRHGMENWFLRQCLYSRHGHVLPAESKAQTGDTYHWLWHGWADDVEETGEILEADSVSTFTFQFGKAGKVSVHITDDGDMSTVQLVQYDIPDTEGGRYDWHLGCKTGWTFYLTNLKSILEGGIDLRNREVGLPHVVNG